MDFGSKLARLKGVGAPSRGGVPEEPAPPSAPSPGTANALVDRVESLEPTPEPAPGLEQAAPFSARPTALGPLHARERVLEPGHRHGVAEVARARDAQGEVLAALALDPSLRGVDPSRMLLLDTETTGLSGGTGTLPFVVGLAWFEDRGLRLSQLVLRRPGEEAPMLRFLEERLRQASMLVTYNGKSFDWPLLRNRFVMNRMKLPPAIPHLDLLHPSRRVYRHRPGGARLMQLEADVLGNTRVGDVPGEEIPELYFRYLRSFDAQLITPVLEHNGLDLVVLASLLGRLADEYRAGHAEDPRDGLGLAQTAARVGDDERALRFAEAAARSGQPAIACEALALAGSLRRQRGENALAERCLRRALELATGVRRAPLHLELAKLYEHALRDASAAMAHARETSALEGADGSAHRVRRLERKAAARGQALTLPFE